VRLVLLLAALAAAQAQPVRFEVASIKPSPDAAGMIVTCRGGPGSRDPGLWTCQYLTLSNLVANAWDLRFDELKAPAWTNDVRFHITAKLPSGATREQFREMQQNLLIDRFGLKFHRERKEVQGYELVVAKNGPKFREKAAGPAKPTTPGDDRSPIQTRASMGADGFPVLPPGMSTAVMQNRARAAWNGLTMDSIARMLAGYAGKPVVDGTGLHARYDISLYWVTAPPTDEASAGHAAPDLFTALQQQLGLKLEPKKLIIDMLVVDHAEKAPTEN
jgi:uncharacterized protein (TIGR03435 family)